MQVFCESTDLCASCIQIPLNANISTQFVHIQRLYTHWHAQIASQIRRIYKQVVGCKVRIKIPYANQIAEYVHSS